MVYLIFMDESGYAGKWENELKKIRNGEEIEQPYYFLSAVLIPLKKYLDGTEQLRRQINGLNLEELPRSSHPFGLGFELKGKNVIRIAERDPSPDRRSQAESILKLIFEVIKKTSGTVILVGINKQEHVNHYRSPDDPYKLALRYTLERVQWFLRNNDDHGIVIYDLNHSFEHIVSNEATLLRRGGSDILRHMRIGEQMLIQRYTLDIDRIVEFTFARSETSAGIIIADFVSAFAYRYHKRLTSPSTSYNWDWEKWWNMLRSVMYRSNNGEIEGFGYKLFPSNIS